MRKIYSLVLIAAGLLIGTNVWAQEPQEEQKPNVCKIGSTEYATLQEAINAVPVITEGTSNPTEIQMIADVAISDEHESAANSRDYYYAKINKGQNVTIDLNNHKIEVITTAGRESAVFYVAFGGYLTLEDRSQEGGGLVSLNRTGEFTNSGSASTIINCGSLVINSGTYKLLSSFDNAGNAAYIIDNITNGGLGNVSCMVTGGTFYSTIECVRNFANSATYTCVLTIKGGEWHGYWGIVFAQDPSGSRSGAQTVTIEGGNFTSDSYALVRLYTTGGENLKATNINITGNVVANVDAVVLHHTSFDSNTDFEELVETLQKEYSNVFNITGGTFPTENYIIKAGGVKWENGQVVPGGNSDAIFVESILPTLLTQDYYDKGNQDGTITVTNVRPENVTDLQGLKDLDNKEGVKANLSQSIEIPTGDVVSVTAIEVKDNAVVTVKKGAKLVVGDAGIEVDEGSKIIVEAGGILQVGSKGIKNLNTNELIVRTNTEASGVVSLAPKALMRQDTKLTVEMTSKARYDGAYYWQYIGIPTNDEPTLQKVSGNAFYLYEWDANAQDWQEASSFNKPFMGYIFSSNATATGAKYNFSGNINNNQNVTFDLKPKWNLLANSYMAPIDLASFFEAMSQTEGVETAISIYDATQGTYKVVTREALKYDSKAFKTLAPMQGFFINTTAGGNCTFDYEQCVWGQESNDPLRAPEREDNSNVSFMKINVSSNHHADEFAMFIGEKYSSSFDNGADASKFMNDHMNLYASLDDNVLASLATDNLVGTQLSFEAGEDVEYTMTFSNRNNDNFVLVDHLTNAQVAMTDGATYTFVATPNETTENRFEIRKAAGVVTNLAEMKAAHAVKGIYTAAGQYVGKADRWNTLPAGMYIVDGVRMAK